MKLWKLAAAAALFACAGHTAFAADGDAYYVLSVLPYESKVTITQGTLDGDTFVAGSESETFSGSKGTIVGKVPGGGTLAVTSVEVYGEDPGAKTDTIAGAYSSAFGVLFGNAPGWRYLPFNLCLREKTLTFTLKPGSVTYVNGLFMAVGDGQQLARGELSLSYASQIDAARAFLGANYSALAGRMEQGSFAMLPARNCKP